MSKIEWTEKTWNVSTGCKKVSPGCKHCYAETMAHRLQAMGAVGYENGFSLSLMPDRLDRPTRRHKPTLWFVNSMSDLFHESIPDTYLDQVFAVIDNTPWHTYQILTKRAESMRDYFDNRTVPSHVWLGVTVEDRRHGFPRLDVLRSINARVRFISAEPLLEDLEGLDLTGMDQALVGGESGPGARPMKPAWVDRIFEVCDRSQTAFFFKQWGRWGPDGVARAKQSNGRLYRGRIWEESPFHRVPVRNSSPFALQQVHWISRSSVRSDPKIGK
ncbi:MAG: phage Gp37/Gp68 family protein [Candidatus Thiodiazotropha sp. (ex Lucinoma kastoroae)]|nr:phage Gp37/Gp68 family protein [Candidatus Thiodiazotropha sp. (ex Lucinoma kastoroae)]MCU7861392.1 phage Gp37/Gp68 family protein [Candidatus Thiodiazotropha sp. (ex Lucinoma kastoroae)]